MNTRPNTQRRRASVRRLWPMRYDKYIRRMIKGIIREIRKLETEPTKIDVPMSEMSKKSKSQIMADLAKAKGWPCTDVALTVDECSDALGNLTIRVADGSPNGDIDADVIATVYLVEFAPIMAAAPAMLAALQAAIDDADSTGCEDCAMISAQFIRQMEAAIALAVTSCKDI